MESEKLKLNRLRNILVNSLVESEDEEVKFRYVNNLDLQYVSAVRSTQKESQERRLMNAKTIEKGWLAEQVCNDIQEVVLSSQTLGSIIKSSGIPSLGFLSLDVEGPRT